MNIFLNLYIHVWLIGINLFVFLHKIFFKLGPIWNATVNPNFCIDSLVMEQCQQVFVGKGEGVIFLPWLLNEDI